MVSRSLKVRSGVIAVACSLSASCGDDRVTAPQEPTVTPQIYGGHRGSCFIAGNGQLYCWGNNVVGQLGIGRTDTVGANRLPERVSATLRFRTVSIGSFFMCGLTITDDAYCWGSNEFGQLGAPTAQRCGPRDILCSVVPLRVGGNLKFRSISAGEFDSVCGLTHDDLAYCWGNNVHAHLGDGTTVNRDAPTAVLTNLRFSEIGVGQSFVCALARTDAAVYCWGNNGGGQLGVPRRSPPGFPLFTEPAPVKVPLDLAFRSVQAGGFHTCALTITEDLYCWGFGPVGIATNEEISPPARVDAARQFRTLAASTFHNCAIAPDGVAFCWGDNAHGKLGTGDTSARSIPTPVATDLRFRSITAGQHHTCALTTAGQVYCWGINSSGEIGVGSTQTPFLTPTAVVGLPR